jgi:hypothetical protein
VGRAYHIKICDFGTGNPAYRRDYAEVEGRLLPLRWMAWESVVEVLPSPSTAPFLSLY